MPDMIALALGAASAFLAVAVSFGGHPPLRDGTSPPHVGERLDFNGFSLLPPQGQGWHVQARYAAGVAFVRPTTESPATVEHAAHTLVATAIFYSRDEAPDGGPEALRNFAEQWSRREGQGSRIIDSQVVPDGSLHAECVRIDAAAEQRRPSLTFRLMLHSFLCRHPYAPKRLFQIGYAERRPDGAPSVLTAEVRRELERFVRSVTFAGPR